MCHSHDARAVPAALALLLLAGCGEPEALEYRLSGPIMGTEFNVAIVADDAFAGGDWRRQVHTILHDVDATLSSYKPDSELSRFNDARSTDWIEVSPAFCEAVALSLALSARSDGAFDVTVGPLVDLWGFGPGESRSTPPDDADIAAARSATGSDKLHADCKRGAMRKDAATLRIDLSAMAKGLAADLVAEKFDAGGLEHYLVEVGGDLRVRGKNARGVEWRIAIEWPESGGREVATIVPLTGGAVATSGDYRNFFESEGTRFSHTIDPRTGRPVTHALASASVVAASAAEADALATALMVLGPDAAVLLAERDHLAAYLLVRNDTGFRAIATPAFAALVAD